MTCENCELDYDPVRYRYRCPHCGWKASCCEGAPAPLSTSAPASPSPAPRVETVTYRSPVEAADCAVCGGPLLRFEGGPYEHFDSRDDVDHFPEPDVGSLTERQLEQQLEEWRTDIPTHSVVTLNEVVEQPRSEYL